MDSPEERWRRLTALLPVNDSREISAYDRVCSWLESEVTGFTKTQPTPSVLQGIWKGEEQIYYDSISMIIIDVPSDDTRLASFVDKIRAKAFAAYADFGSPQEEIWVTAEDMVLPTVA